MLTSKQRAYLRSLAVNEDTILMVGKSGMGRRSSSRRTTPWKSGSSSRAGCCRRPALSAPGRRRRNWRGRRTARWCRSSAAGSCCTGERRRTAKSCCPGKGGADEDRHLRRHPSTPFTTGTCTLWRSSGGGWGWTGCCSSPTRCPLTRRRRTWPSPAQRLEMCHLAAGDIPWLELCRIEMDREGKSYTAETLEELSVLYPQDQFYPAHGGGHVPHRGPVVPAGDHFLPGLCVRFPQELGRHGRPAEKGGGVPGALWGPCFLDHIPYLPVSSTQVRQEVARGGDISGLVPQAVADYIEQCGLYRSK